MNLLRTLASISGMTMLSRVTGLVRDILIATLFGADARTDVFNIAFRIPNLLRRLFAEGAFSQAFVPILAEYKNSHGDVATRQLIDRVGTVMTWTLLLTCVLGIMGAPVLLYFFAEGYVGDPVIFDMAIVMTRIMFPYIGFMSLVALGGGILNTWREFKVPAFTPVLYNLSSIACSWLLAPHLAQPVYALAIGVFIGGVLQLGVQVPALLRIGMLPRISWHLGTSWQDEGVRRIMRNMVPAILAVSATQISIAINSNIASKLTPGSVTWLANADRLMEFPTALLGVALGTILLPGLSKANADGDTAEYSSLLDWGLRLTFLLALPAAVGLATIPEALTSTLFHHNKYSGHAVQMTSNALIAYGLGLLGLIVVKILAPGFYGKQDIRTPVKIAVAVMLVTQGLNYIFVPYFAHAGLALSVGLGACVNAVFLYTGLRRRGIYHPQKGWGMFLLKLCAALFLMAGIALWTSDQFHWLAMRSTPFLRVGALALVISASAATYFAALILMGFRPRDFKKVTKV
ncbi:murein biosynthesis integral membrane protein MurJ [Undibacterium sp. TS12]|uniref:murein biosynthesis integral membrane protein MurJ n=1 Tax=Undibacterium sp. TS12 TaxID=2908202 RepID=UPI001F4D0893|nr:murein biosynthesis integral membrane protein MurJ [Undibacterium sp. TS12]MCH8622377.1 murein biosynthesis integral membrane protein MurJ [Undibacterium sp. TS12]